jgi:bacterial/archaeal transporter family protein
MQTALLLAGCMAAWGLAAFLMKIAGQKLDAYTCSVFALPGYLLMGLLIAPRANYQLTWHHGVAVAIGALYVLGNMAFYKLCQTQHVSLLSAVTGVNIIIPIVMGWVLLGEPISIRRVVGIVLAVAAIVLLNWPERSSAP